MTDPRAATLRARVFAAAQLHVAREAHLAQQADQDAATERLVQQIADRAPADSDVAALVARYRSGSLSVTELQTQARQALQDYYDDALDGVQPGARADHHILSAGLLLGAIGGLAALHGHGTEQVGKAASTLSQSAGAAEYGGSVTRAERNAAAEKINDRLAAIRGNGDLSPAQQAAQTQTAIHNHSWTAYQERRNTEAKGAGHTVATWVLDAEAQHCTDCQGYADDSPYAIEDLPTLPGQGDSECGPGCKCDVTYSSTEAGDDTGTDEASDEESD